jgi:hypothetical protein
MDASMNLLSEVRLGLDEKDIQNLQKKRQIRGKIWIETGETLPLVMRVRYKIGAYGLPIDKAYEEIISYIIDITPRMLSRVKGGKVLDLGELYLVDPDIRLRHVYIGLDNVL